MVSKHMQEERGDRRNCEKAQGYFRVCGNWKQPVLKGTWWACRSSETVNEHCHAGGIDSASDVTCLCEGLVLRSEAFDILHIRLLPWLTSLYALHTMGYFYYTNSTFKWSLINISLLPLLSVGKSTTPPAQLKANRHQTGSLQGCIYTIAWLEGWDKFTITSCDGIKETKNPGLPATRLVVLCMTAVRRW